jgi:hypothetical protein
MQTLATMLEDGVEPGIHHNRSRRDPSGRLHRLGRSLVQLDGTETHLDTTSSRFLIFYPDGSFAEDCCRERCTIRMRTLPDGTLEQRVHRWK